jgi:phosphatidylglycerol:prolipoprotein diacylglycerol transferase
VKPILFGFESFAIPSYLALLVLGTCVLVWLSTLTAGRHSLPQYHVACLLSVAYAAGLLGARLLFVLENHSRLSSVARPVLSPVPGGFASHGAFLLAVPVAVLYASWFQLPLGKIVDSTAIGLCMFGALARLGCFLGGCCYGRPTSLPWGFVFPQGSDPAARWGFGVPVHPTQLYEAGYLTLIAVLLLLMEKRTGFDGEKFVWLVFAYSGARFLNEFVRGDSLLQFWGLSPPQWISLVLAILSLGSITLGRNSAGSSASNGQLLRTALHPRACIRSS